MTHLLRAFTPRRTGFRPQRRRLRRGRRLRVRTGALLVSTLVAGLGTLAAAGPGTAAPAAVPRLTGPHACAPVQPGFTCSTLTVPLDHAGSAPGTLDLQVATENNADAPKGVLLFLTGGPGQAGVVAAASTAAERLPELRKDYRLVTVDQRGTGALGALNCPKLQARTGSSDIAAPSGDAVQECAGILGATARFYSTDQTVADLDQLRQALGVRKMVIDGTSYGSTVAARYAIAHPANTRKVVLDSVLPHHLTAADSLYLTGLTAEARVLRDACAAAPACGFDPAKDLNAVVKRLGTADGVRVFDMMVVYEFIDPTFRNPDVPGMPAGVGDAIGAVHAAAGGDRAGLDALLTTLAPGGDDVARFSSGLHAATVCSDFRFPWGDSSTPVAGRQAALDRAEATLTQARTFPYTPGVATHQGFVQTCLPWPAEKPGPNPGGRLPNVPVLLLSGTHDLSTPTEWARQELAQAPQGKLVVVPGASHSIQNRETGRVGRDAVIAFLES